MAKSTARSNITEALIMSVWAGVVVTLDGSVFVGCFYFFEPVAKVTILRHTKELVLAGIAVFAVAFATMLEATLWAGFVGQQ